VLLLSGTPSSNAACYTSLNSYFNLILGSDNVFTEAFPGLPCLLQSIHSKTVPNNLLVSPIKRPLIRIPPLPWLPPSLPLRQPPRLPSPQRLPQSGATFASAPKAAAAASAVSVVTAVSAATAVKQHVRRVCTSG
jgi:hypothetical protein